MTPVERLTPALLLLALLTLLTLLGPARAAATVDISAVVGFSDTFRPGHWTPLTVNVGNRGSDLSGELEVQVTVDDVTRGRQLVTYHRRTLDLHRDSRKSLQFIVLPQALSHPLVIRMRSGGREIARADVDLRTRFAPQRLLLVLSRNADLDYLNDASIDGLRVLYPHPELLPAHWRGYDAVAGMVLHGVSLERLSTSQFEALNKWIAQGGVLAVSGGPDYTLLQSRRLAALLPGVPAGMTPVEGAALQRALSDSIDVSRPVHVNRLGGFEGEVRLRANEVPLVIERRIGHGRVLYLTFDVARHPFARWDGMRDLWLQTLELPATSPHRALEESSSNALTALLRAEAPDFPPYSVAFLFVTLYLGLLFAGCAIPSRSKSPQRWQLLGGPAVALAFAPVAWLLFGPASYPRGASTATVALIEPFPGSSYARLALELGMYATRSGPLRLEYRGTEPVLFPHRQAQREGKVENWLFVEGLRPSAQPLDSRRYVLHALEGEDVIAYHLEASLQDAAGGANLLLNNASGRRLENVWLVFDGFAYALGALPAGARIERRLLPGEGVATGETAWRKVLEPAQSLQMPAEHILLERRALAMGEGGYPRRGNALLIGYTANPLQPVGASAGWPRQERALVAFQFPVENGAPGESRSEEQARGPGAPPAQPAREPKPSAREDE